MIRLLKSLGVVALLVIFSGCYMAPVMPPQGIIFTDIEAPLDADAEATPVGMKQGRAASYSILWLFAFGDASTAAAAQQGNLNRVHHLDYEYVNFLGIYQHFVTIAHGE